MFKVQRQNNAVYENRVTRVNKSCFCQYLNIVSLLLAKPFNTHLKKKKANRQIVFMFQEKAKQSGGGGGLHREMLSYV